MIQLWLFFCSATGWVRNHQLLKCLDVWFKTSFRTPLFVVSLDQQNYNKVWHSHWKWIVGKHSQTLNDLNGSAVFADYMYLLFFTRTRARRRRRRTTTTGTTGTTGTTTNNQQPTTNKQRTTMWQHFFTPPSPTTRPKLPRRPDPKTQGGNATEGLRKSCTPQGAPDFSQKVTCFGKGHGGPLISMKSRLVKYLARFFLVIFAKWSNSKGRYD